jgi:outer membrane protein TolC
MQRDVLAPSTVNLSILQESYRFDQLRMIDVLKEQHRLLNAQLITIDAQQDAQRTWAEL